MLYYQPDLVWLRAQWLPNWENRDPIYVVAYFHLIDLCFFAPSSIWNGCGRGMSSIIVSRSTSIQFLWLNLQQWKLTPVSFLSLWYPELSPMAGVRWPGQCFKASVPHTVCDTPIASHYSQTSGIRTRILCQTLKPHWQFLTAVLRCFSCFTGFNCSFFS